MENEIYKTSCNVKDCYDKTLFYCMRLIEKCTKILSNNRILNQQKSILTTMEIEYSTFMLKYLNVLLKSLESKTCIKIEVLKLNDFMPYEFRRLRFKYETDNQFNYFSLNDENFFMRNIKLFLNTKQFIETKLGLIYLRYLHYYLNKLKDKLVNYDKKNFEFTNNREIFKYSRINFHIKYLCIIVYYFIIPTKDHLYNLQTNDKRWQDIYSNLEIKLVKSFQDGKKSMNWSNRFTNYIHALFYKIEFDKFNSRSVIQILNLLFYGVYYWFKPELSKYIRKYNVIKPNLQIIKYIFETLENPLVKLFSDFLKGKVRINEIKYIHSYKNEDCYLYNQEDVRYNRNTYTQFTILSNFDLYCKKFKIKSIFNKKPQQTFFSLLLKQVHSQFIPSYNVIFHVHGGGFFSQTTESSMIYLSDWVNQFKTVIFSIDYRLAPDNKYPNLIDENIRAYEKIIMNTTDMFGFKIKKLVVTGDSGGGLMCLNIIKHAIKNNLRVPDGVVLLYPCSRILYECCTPSLLMSIKDNYIDPTIILNLQRIVLELDKHDISFYKNDDKLDFYISDPNIVRKFPKTMIILASNDPLRDEGYMLADFLLQNHVNVTIKEFLFFCHGFINLTKVVQTYYKSGKIEIEKFLKSIFD